MTEDQIEPLCLKLYKATKAQKSDEANAVMFELLAGFLTDINRIAWFMQQDYENRENERRGL